MDPPDPPPPNLDPLLPASNVYVCVVPGKNQLNTFQRIKVLSELKATSVFPSKLIENPITIITLFYEKHINLSLALASTLLFKKGIEAEIRNGTLELGLVGLLDHNISFQATAKKECAIYFNAVVDDNIIKLTLDLLMNVLGSSYIAQEYGFVPPKRYEYLLYFIPYLLGFLREEVESALTRAGNEPKHFKILQGKSGLNSGTNIIGTHGNLILKTEVGSLPLTSINVPTNRGTFNLALEQRDFYTSSLPKDSNQSASTVPKWVYKTQLCTYHANGKECYSGASCPYAHGVGELRTKEHQTKRGSTRAPTVVSGEPTAVNGQSGVDSVVVVDADLMVTDEVQPGDRIISEPTSAVNVQSGVDSVDVVDAEGSIPIISGGNLVPGDLCVSKISSSSITSAIVTNVVGSLTVGASSVPVVTTTPSAMFMGSYVEKNAASTIAGDINTPTNLNTTSPSGPKLSKSERRRTKRAASSPLEGATAKSSTTGLSALSPVVGAVAKASTTGLSDNVLFAVPEYDIDFPSSPMHTSLTPKGVTKEKGIPKSAPVTTTPVFALNGKKVPSASATGAFTYEVLTPLTIVKSGREKKDGWSTIGVNKVFTAPVGTSIKTGKTTSASTTASSTIADVGSTAKGPSSPAATNLKATINVQKTSPLKQQTTPKPTGVNFRKQTGNKFQALSDSANCYGGVSAQ